MLIKYNKSKIVSIKITRRKFIGIVSKNFLRTNTQLVNFKFIGKAFYSNLFTDSSKKTKFQVKAEGKFD